MIKPARRLFRYSFIRFICVVGVFWLLFLIYMSTWNIEFFTDVNQKFSDIGVRELFKGVIEKNLTNEELRLIPQEQDNTEVHKPDFQIHSEEHKFGDAIDDDYNIENFSESTSVEPRPVEFKKTIPKPLLPTEILNLHARMNLTNPGHMGAPVLLPAKLDPDIERMLNESREKYQINEFVSSLIPLDRKLPDIRTNYCKRMTYSKNLPMASVIMVFHNEAISMILRSLYAILNRSPGHLLREIILIDDCSDIGEQLN